MDAVGALDRGDLDRVHLDVLDGRRADHHVVLGLAGAGRRPTPAPATPARFASPILMGMGIFIVRDNLPGRPGSPLFGGFTALAVVGHGVGVLPREIIPAAAIARRVAELGAEIDARLPPGPLTVVGVLRGAFMFMADLVRAIPRELTCDFLGVRSYGDATVSSGVVEITSDLGGADRGPPRPAGRGHRRHRPDPEVPGRPAAGARAGRRPRLRADGQAELHSRPAGLPSTSSASTRRTRSSSATAWTPRSCTGTFRTWPRSTPPKPRSDAPGELAAR